ncbi:ferritin-like domain-containing protein [Methylobrevis albus]|uniref:Ferritin-like domain-containing protein n=1 Tax=Methylobrevis albus TaxID=2793297 RepID=A0A931I4Q4_9HYPH|nr:ferritin-like domain-containing protein [Methylobrevis albus]MBH0239221.1 ferritin-like domain-containing protein [Methylobrevis albus]
MTDAGTTAGDDTPTPDTLRESARLVVATADLDAKVDLAYATAKAWFSRRLGRGSGRVGPALAERPGRPEKPVLLAPRDMPRRSSVGLAGRIALVHSLAHIELNAVDLTWDLVARFVDQPVPRSFFDDWVQVGLEEAKHFSMLAERLRELGAAYGDLPAHDGLWQAAEATGFDLRARLAVIPLVLEARGLDVTPVMADKVRAGGDDRTAAILDVIYRDEKRHVAFGAKWFRFLCDRDGVPPEPAFHDLVRRCFRGALKPPFNDRARSEAGLTPGFYKPLAVLKG